MLARDSDHEDNDDEYVDEGQTWSQTGGSTYAQRSKEAVVILAATGARGDLDPLIVFNSQHSAWRKHAGAHVEVSRVGLFLYFLGYLAPPVHTYIYVHLITHHSVYRRTCEMLTISASVRICIYFTSCILTHTHLTHTLHTYPNRRWNKVLCIGSSSLSSGRCSAGISSVVSNRYLHPHIETSLCAYIENFRYCHSWDAHMSFHLRPIIIPLV